MSGYRCQNSDNTDYTAKALEIQERRESAKFANGIENGENRGFRCQFENYVNQSVLIMSSKLKENAVFDDKPYPHVHLRRKKGCLVHVSKLYPVEWTH